MNVPTIREVMTDPALFGNQFSGDSWAAWRALLAGFYGLPMDDDETEAWETLTALKAPETASDELWLVVGRRGGKSQCAALLAVYEACFRDHRPNLSPGEVATVRVMAADKAQARTVMRYVVGLIESNPMLERMAINIGRESVRLDNRAMIEVGTASFRSVRGYTYAAIVADEIAFWRSDESANPDAEILAAVRPGLATLNGKLIALSSPYAKRGEMWRTYQRHYGKPGAVLVAQAPTKTLNPKIPQRIINDAMERDPEAAKAEYLAQFRSDLEQFLQREVIERAVRPDPLEIPYNEKYQYRAFVDPAGGGQDEFCICIGHAEGDQVIIDLVRGRRGDPAEITAGYSKLLKAYKVGIVRGDKYAGSYPANEFRKHGITYNANAKPKSELYVDLLPAMNSGRVEIPPDDKIVSQLTTLERRTSRAGKDSIDHAPGAHDDRANVIAGLVASMAKTKPKAVTRRLKAL